MKPMKLLGKGLNAVDANGTCPDNTPSMEEGNIVTSDNSKTLVYICSPNTTPHSTMYLWQTESTQK